MKKTAFFLTALAAAALAALSCNAAVVVGAVFPLSGGAASYGRDSWDGARLAADELNAAGGILGRRLVLIAEDDENNPEKAVKALTKLTSQDKASFVLGSSTSSATKAIAALAQRMRVVLISPSATDIEVTKAGDFIFRACFINPFQGVAGADFAYDVLGSRRAAILFDAWTDYNSGLADAFLLRFTQRGGGIAADEVYQTGAEDFNAQAARIKDAAPDVVYLPNYYNDAARQAKQLRAWGVNCALVGGDGWDTLTGIENLGDEVLRGFWSSGFTADTLDPKGAAFVKAFQERYGRAASQSAALGYDAMLLLAGGIQAAGGFDPAAVKDALAALEGSYVTGDIRFDGNRNPIKSAAILEIVKKDGKFVNAYKTTVTPQ
ncbi:MAG: ABC transporter substrate-binding protein [Treponema sp.]|jgi:branched-chain amino acid transport system substrate-binding protein|nr:ABC transporter substrate-binding protein [Treponema sp.]